MNVGRYLPTFSSSIITTEWLIKVKERDINIPLYNQIKLRPCTNPPTKEYLIREVQSYGRESYGIDQNHQPDKSWLMRMLSTLTPDHKIFTPKYDPLEKPAEEKEYVDNADGFYDEIHLTTKAKKASKKGRSWHKTQRRLRRNDEDSDFEDDEFDDDEGDVDLDAYEQQDEKNQKPSKANPLKASKLVRDDLKAYYHNQLQQMDEGHTQS